MGSPISAIYSGRGFFNMSFGIRYSVPSGLGVEVCVSNIGILPILGNSALSELETISRSFDYSPISAIYSGRGFFNMSFGIRYSVPSGLGVEVCVSNIGILPILGNSALSELETISRSFDYSPERAIYPNDGFLSIVRILILTTKP